MDNNEQIVNAIAQKEKIEEVMFHHNTTYYQQAMQTLMCQDKTCNKLQEDEIRNNILDGKLKRNQCDNGDVYQFLTLLKQPKNRRRIENRVFKEVTQE